MADPNTRQGKRTPVTLKIKFKSETLEQFIERYAVDVSQGGIFIRTKEPLAVGTQMKFEFQLKDASPLIAGEGTVVWTRENDPSRPAIAPGMGVRFDRLAEGSQQVLEKILAEKVKQAPHRGGNESVTKPPLFTDTPTRVAPAPVQDAMLGSKGAGQRAKHDSEQTPLPNPMPFHSDAEDFDENAFQEATKVRSVDDLVAATAGDDHDDAETKSNLSPPDELAARRSGSQRAETPLAEPPLPAGAVPDRDSAPGLPSPPDGGRGGRMLDTSPSPRTEAPKNDLSGSTRLGMEPARVATKDKKPKNEATEKVAVPRAIPTEPSRPTAPNRPSSAPIVIAILVVVAAALGGVYWFVIRPDLEEETPPAKGSAATVTPTPGSAATVTPPTPGSATAAGSNAGSAQPMPGSAATPGSAAHAPPSGPTVETTIAANVGNATVEVEDGPSGPAPLAAKLEKDKTYKVHVKAPGFATLDLDVKGGQDKVVAKLVAKPHTLDVSSEPPGAQILVDNAPTGKVTPAEVELTAAQAAKPKLHVTLRKAGFLPVDQMLDAAAFTDSGDAAAKLTAKVAATLTKAPTPPPGGGNVKPPGGGNVKAPGGGSSDTTPAGGSAGSAPPPPPPTGDTTKPAGGGSASGSEPEPDFVKKP